MVRCNECKSVGIYSHVSWEEVLLHPHVSFVKGIRGWEAGSKALYLGVLSAGSPQALVTRLGCVGHDAPPV